MKTHPFARLVLRLAAALLVSSAVGLVIFPPLGISLFAGFLFQCVLLLAAVLIALWPFVKQAGALSKGFDQLAGGDYRYRIPGVKNHGELAKKFNHVADRMEAELRSTVNDKGQLNTILSNMSESVVAVDRDGRIIAVNPTLVTQFGLDSANLMGRPFVEVLRHTPLNDLLRRTLEDAKPRQDEVTTFAPEEQVFEAHAVALKEGGESIGALLVLHDITRLRKLEQMRKDFVANVSHELRTPLASIKGFAETLRLGAIDDKPNRMDFVAGIESQADHMTQLVDDLLALATIESVSPTKDDLVNLFEVSTDVVRNLQPLAVKLGVLMEISSVVDVPPVPGNRQQIQQVLTNLVDNAIKFNKQGGRVVIRIRVSPIDVVTEVVDTGLGIPEADLSRVFERFYRVDKARSRERGGSGLGLAIVKHIVEGHGGQVSVNSRPAQGSTFRFSLPR